MHIDVVTLFPEAIISGLSYSIIGRAQKTGKLTLTTTNLREFGIGKYQAVDGAPYGGGKGMIIRVDVVDASLSAAKKKFTRSPRVILMDTRGKRFSQMDARRLSNEAGLILVCGHYEGVDERVRQLVDETISLGDFVLTGGEPAAVAVIDATARLIDGVLEAGVTKDESFERKDHNGNLLLEYPQYTQPRTHKGMKVPEVLLKGNHAAIADWRSKSYHKPE